MKEEITVGIRDMEETGDGIAHCAFRSMRFLLIYLLLFNLIMHSVLIGHCPTCSMYPTIKEGVLVTCRTNFNTSSLKRGDIVCFYPSPGVERKSHDALAEKKANGDNSQFIKRIVGLPGELVEVRDYNDPDLTGVYIDGEKLEEKYIFDPMIIYSDWEALEQRDCGSYTSYFCRVPEHHFFFMGDNRNMSNDSRDFGPVDSAHVYAKYLFSFLPFSKVFATVSP